MNTPTTNLPASYAGSVIVYLIFGGVMLIDLEN